MLKKKTKQKMKAQKSKSCWCHNLLGLILDHVSSLLRSCHLPRGELGVEQHYVCFSETQVQNYAAGFCKNKNKKIKKQKRKRKAKLHYGTFVHICGWNQPVTPESLKARQAKADWQTDQHSGMKTVRLVSKNCGLRAAIKFNYVSEWPTQMTVVLN